MSKGTQGEKTQLEFLRAAERLFASRGYFNTSMNDLLDATGFSKGAFYHHFASKDEVAVRVLGQVRVVYQREVVEPVRVIAPGERFAGALALIVELHAGGGWPYHLLLSRFMMEMSEYEGELAEKTVELIGWVIDFWEEIVQSDQVAEVISREYDPRELGELVVSLLTGAIAGEEVRGDLVSLERAVGVLQQMVLG